MLRLSDRTVDLARGVVHVGGDELRLTTKETQLLAYLAARPGTLVPRDTLLEEVWGYRPTATTRAVDNMMRKLRVKIEAEPNDPVHLLTVFGEGYRFDPAPAPVPSASVGIAPPASPELGREALVGQLERWLAEGRRCLCLVGPAGIGKSTVARRLAVNSACAWWCRVGGSRDLELAVGAAVGASADGLARVLEAAPCLLVLDGADALDAQAEETLGAWIARYPGLDAVATSRQRRFARFATVVEVPPLERSAARAVLDRCVDRVRPDRPLADAEADALLDRLDGWPAAIELAAARLRFLAADEVVARLDESRLAVLNDPAGSGLHAALGETVRALDPADQEVFAACSVFPRDFSPSDAEAVAGRPDAVDGLHRLVDHSLLRPLGDGRLAMLDPIREVAARTLSEPGPVRLRYVARFAEVADAIRVPPVDRHLARARRDWDNLWHALDLAVQIDPEAAGRIAVCAIRELARRGHHERRLLLIAEVLAARPPGRYALALRMARLETSALLRRSAGEDLQALESDLRVCGDPELLAQWSLYQMRIARRNDDYPEAERLCRRAFDEVQGVEAPYVFVRPWSRLLLAQLTLDEGRLDEAVELLGEAIALARAASDTELEGKGLLVLGFLEMRRHRLAAAAAALEQAVARCGDHPWIRSDARMTLAQVALGRGRGDEAERLVELAREDVLRVGNRDAEAAAYAIRGELRMEEGDLAAAEAQIREFERLSEEQHRKHAAVQLGQVRRLGGEPERAREQLVLARDLARANLAHQLGADVTALLAAVLAELDDLDGASAELAAARDAEPAYLALAQAHLAAGRARAASGSERSHWLAEGAAIRDALAAEPEVSVRRRAELRHLTADLARSGT